MNRTVLRGVIQYKVAQGSRSALLHFNYLHPKAPVRLKDMRPPTAAGKLELLEQLAVSLRELGCEAIHQEWVDTALRDLSAAKEALRTGDTESAISRAIDGAMLVGDLAAAIHTRSVFRDMKRQIGASKGARALKRCQGIELAAERLAQEHPDWSEQRAWNELCKHSPDSPFPAGDYAVYADGPDDLYQRDENTGAHRAIARSSFSRYWARAKKNCTK